MMSCFVNSSFFFHLRTSYWPPLLSPSSKSSPSQSFDSFLRSQRSSRPLLCNRTLFMSTKDLPPINAPVASSAHLTNDSISNNHIHKEQVFPPFSLIPVANSTVAVVGGGPSGLLSAIMLARRGFQKVIVVEKRSRPPPSDALDVWGDPNRSYNLGITIRGIHVLEKMSIYDKVAAVSALMSGRRDWDPQGNTKERIEKLETSRQSTLVLQRDRLVAAILETIQEQYEDQIQVYHEIECVDVLVSSSTPSKTVVTLSQSLPSSTSNTIEADLVIGADGVGSAVHEFMKRHHDDKVNHSFLSMFDKKFYVKKYKPFNTVVYKTVLLDFTGATENGPGDKPWIPNLNYSARGKDGVTLEILPTKEGKGIGLVLFKPDNHAVLENLTHENIRSFFDANFFDLSRVISDQQLEIFLSKPVSKLPEFQYCGPYIASRNVLLIGDAIHVVKPYFGLGLNTAFEDVSALDDCLKEATFITSSDTNQHGVERVDLTQALTKYSKARAPQARALVEISHKLDQGFLFFVFPLIVDTMFHNWLPKIFQPSILRCIGKGDKTFTQVRWRKRLDRVMQFMVVISLLLMVAMLFRTIAIFVLQRLSKFQRGLNTYINIAK